MGWTNRDEGGWNEWNKQKAKSSSGQRSQEDVTTPARQVYITESPVQDVSTWHQSTSKTPDESSWHNRGSEWSNTGEDGKQNDEWWVEQQTVEEENSDHYAEMSSYLYEMLN